ncbi:MAG: WYL domain-containing protein [Candidatus Woesearchaeota archaeon]
MKKQTEFTDSELEAIYQLIREYQENSPEDDGGYYDYDDYEEQIDSKVIKSIIKKISKSIPKDAKEEIDKDFLRQKYHTYNNQINERVYSTLKKAFQELKRVEIKYFDMESAEFKKREIDVYYTSAKYTIGYCHLRKAMRKFRTSRIGSAKLTDKTYKIPKNFNKNDC